MLGLSLVMARYLLWRDEIASGTHQDGVVWRGVMGALWPIRVAVRGLLALFWLAQRPRRARRRRRRTESQVAARRGGSMRPGLAGYRPALGGSA